MSSDDPLTLQCAQALADHDDAHTILEYIEEGADVGELVDHLWDAVQIGSEALVRVLLDAGADPEQSPGSSSSPLELAASRGLTDLVAAMLEFTPAHDRDSLRRPLHTAITRGHHDTAALLASTTTPDRARPSAGTLALPPSSYADLESMTFAPLVMVAFQGWDDVARRLLALGHSPNERSVVVERETLTAHEHVPAIVAATMAGHASMVRLLLGAGADPSAVDGHGRTALMHAQQRGHAEIQRLLGNVASEPTLTAIELLAAADDGDVPRVARVLAAGVDVDAVPRDGAHRGHSALGRAAAKGHVALVSSLLAAGADVDHPSDHPPLVQAAAGGHVGVIERLVEAGADLERRDRLGCPPLLMAAGCDGGSAAAIALIDAGADVHATDVQGQTALSHAVALGSLPLIDALLARGADPRAIDRDGRSPLDDAREYLDPGPVRARIERAVAEAEAAGAPVFDGHPYRERLARIQEEIDAIDASDYDHDAVRARLEAGASTPAFAAIIERLQSELGAEPAPLTGYRYRPALPGVRFDLPRSIDPAPLAERYADTGALVFALSEGRFGGNTSIAALATSDPLDAVAVIRPAGPNYDVGPEDFLRWAIHVHRAHPFRLTYLHTDLVEGSFLADLPDPMLMAERVYDICPDAVDQGHETVEALAASLAERRLYLWWD